MTDVADVFEWPSWATLTQDEDGQWRITLTGPVQGCAIADSVEPLQRLVTAIQSWPVMGGAR